MRLMSSQHYDHSKSTDNAKPRSICETSLVNRRLLDACENYPAAFQCLQRLHDR